MCNNECCKECGVTILDPSMDYCKLCSPYMISDVEEVIKENKEAVKSQFSQNKG